MSLVAIKLRLHSFIFLLLLGATKGPMALGELASYLFREPNSVFDQLSRMQKAGLVTKVRDKDDQRVARGSITPKGKGATALTTRNSTIREDLENLPRGARSYSVS